MKKRSVRKIFAMLLAGLLTVSVLAGCNGGDGGSSTASSASSAAQSSEAESQEAPSAAGSEDSSEAQESDASDGAQNVGAFDEEVTLRVPVYDRGVEGVPTVNDNYWTGWVQENFGDPNNIKVEYVPIARTDVITDYALLASSKNLPTILMEYDFPKVAQWAADGYLTTFDMDAFAEAAPTYYETMEKNELLDFSIMNDETYFALAERPFWDTGFTYVRFVRMDWLKEIGYDHIPVDPENYEEYLDAMTKIKEAGLAEYPVGGEVYAVGADQNYGFRTLPQDETEWAMYSSVAIPSLGWEPDYKVLKRMNGEYNAGLMNPEFYITDKESAKARFVNGETYRYGDYISASVDWVNSFYEQNPDGELAIEPVPTKPDEKGGTTPAYRADNPFGMIVGFSSTATQDEITAAWMYMEWMSQEDVRFEMQWGFEGENYVMDADSGLPESVGDYEGEFKQGYNNNKDYWCIASESRNAGTAEEMIPTIVPKGHPQDFTQGVLDVYHGRVKASEEGYAMTDPLFTTTIDAEVEYGASLLELFKEYRDTLIMTAPEEFDAKYEELSKNYADQGFQAVTEGRKEAFEAGQSTHLQ